VHERGACQILYLSHCKPRAGK